MYHKYDLIPVDDVVGIPVCKVNGWDAKAIKKMIREGTIEGKTENHDYYVSEASLHRRSAILALEHGVRSKVLEFAAKGLPIANFEEITFLYLANKFLGINEDSLDGLIEAINKR